MAGEVVLDHTRDYYVLDDDQVLVGYVQRDGVEDLQEIPIVTTDGILHLDEIEAHRVAQRANQVRQDPREVLPRNPHRSRDLLGLAPSLLVVHREVEHRAHGVVALLP